MRDRPWLAIVAIVSVSCGSPGGGAMICVPPPSGWDGRVLADRADRDRSFRESPDTPLLVQDRATFAGLDYWELDSEYRFVGAIEAYDAREPFEIITTSGQQRKCEKYGRVTFDLNGTRRTLQVYRLLDTPGGPSLFLPFTDRTTGKETYPSGRYIDLDGEPGGLYVLDFNRAYNPSCAYGAAERFACPVTPAENRLETRVEAGERGYRKLAPRERS